MKKIRLIKDIEAEVLGKAKTTTILAGTVLTVYDDEADRMVAKGMAEMLGNAQNSPSGQGGLARKSAHSLPD